MVLQTWKSPQSFYANQYKSKSLFQVGEGLNLSQHHLNVVQPTYTARIFYLLKYLHYLFLNWHVSGLPRVCTLPRFSNQAKKYLLLSLISINLIATNILLITFSKITWKYSQNALVILDFGVLSKIRPNNYLVDEDILKSLSRKHIKIWN